MRIMSLGEMLAELRHEARISSDVAHGTHLRDRYISLLRRVQEDVYLSYDWPALNVSATVDLIAGQRYAAYPSRFTYDGIMEAFAQNASGKWLPLTRGIGACELNAVDSDSGEQRAEVRRWQNYLSPDAEVVNTNMFEVWPVPNRDVRIRFQGQQKLKPLADADRDSSTVDGIIVVLHAASEILAGTKAEDASLKLQRAQERHRLLRQRQVGADAYVPNMVGPRTAPKPHPTERW